MKKLYLVILFIFTVWMSYAGNDFDRFHVLINVASNEQPDSLGYNIVSGISAVIYKNIINGRITLWDSPKKEIQILPNTLISIENSNKTRFSSIENLLIHEIWDIGKMDVKIATTGFEFIKKTPGKEDMEFGYVDYDDAMITLKSTFSEPNADGFWYVTFDQLLKLRNYPYTIIKLGDNRVKNADESERYKHIVFDKKEYKPDMEAIQFNKRVCYSIEENHLLQNDKKFEMGNLLLSSFEEFLNDNFWIYNAINGIQFNDSVKIKPPPHLKVSKAEVTEIWNMNGTYLSFQPQSIVLYINDTAQRPITMDELSKWEIVVDFKGVEDFLKEKPFFYIITKINNQPVDRFSAYKYQKALLNADWRTINKYVKDEL